MTTTNTRRRYNVRLTIDGIDDGPPAVEVSATDRADAVHQALTGLDLYGTIRVEDVHADVHELGIPAHRVARAVELELERRALRPKVHTRTIGRRLADIGLEYDRLVESVARELGLTLSSVQISVDLIADRAEVGR